MSLEKLKERYDVKTAREAVAPEGDEPGSPEVYRVSGDNFTVYVEADDEETIEALAHQDETPAELDP